MKWNINDVIHGFKVKKMEYIHEVVSDAYELEHIQSGAKLLYLNNSDDNKVFYICFRTTPDNSKGTPHIMEHSTLCGSRKFPLKEPFVELIKGSLNTFLNAMTWPDKTMYPVASRNNQDFHNLMDVYLDAVFYPNCIKDPQILMQEGWHYEMENKEGPLTYNGVVYNEMKGALSSPEALLQNVAMEALFPDVTYAVESGGDPEVIPSLSFKEFTEFHRKFYHPSNSYLYLYGDMDIESTLQFIDEEYLSSFKKQVVDTEVKTQSTFSVRKECVGKFGITDEENETNKSIHALFTACDDHMSTANLLALKILNYTLIDMEGAPLKKALIDVGICNDVSGALETSLKQPVWTIEITGSNPDDKEKFANIVDTTIRKLTLGGIDKEMLTAALNRAEFILRESDFQGKPKGLYYGIHIMQMWLYDREPLQALRYEENLKILRNGIDEGYFEALLLKYFVQNEHQVLVTMNPEKGLTEKKNFAIAEQLEDFKQSLSDEQLNHIIETTKALKVRQASRDTEEALKTIPLLSRTDLNKKIEIFTQTESEICGITRLSYDDNTSGITYLNLFFNLNNLDSSEVSYAYLLMMVLESMNTVKYTYEDITRISNMYTGGLSFTVSCYGHKSNNEKYVPVVVVRGKSLTTNVDKMMELLGQILNHTDYRDTNRLKELLMEEKAAWDMSLFERGHSLVMQRLMSYYSKVAKFKEQGSLSYYYFLNELVATFDENSSIIIDKLKQVASKIFVKNNLTIQEVGGIEERAAVSKHIHLLIDDMLEGVPCNSTYFVFEDSVVNEGFLSSGKVQYVARGGNFRQHGFSYTGVLRVLETIVRFDYLWKNVRVLGGAYGAFTQFATNGDSFLCSYRDPNLSETLNVYKNMPEYIKNFNVSEREMTKYVIGTIASSEVQLTPLMKAERAMVMRYSGMTNEERQHIREEIINCSVEDIRNTADLVNCIVNAPYFCVLGSEEKIKAEHTLFNKVRSLRK